MNGSSHGWVVCHERANVALYGPLYIGHASKDTSYGIGFTELAVTGEDSFL